MNRDHAAQLAALHRRMAGLRDDAKRRPHLRYLLDGVVAELEAEARVLEHEIERLKPGLARAAETLDEVASDA